MTTEAKIREAFEKYKASKIYPESVAYGYFRGGYLALLNELEPVAWSHNNGHIQSDGVGVPTHLYTVELGWTPLYARKEK